MQRSLLTRLRPCRSPVLALVLGACSGPAGGSAAPTRACGSRRRPGGSAQRRRGHRQDRRSTRGSAHEANAAVVKSLLEDKLGYTVTATPLAEEVAWQGFETGEVDVILENWGHPDLEKKYITDKGVAQDAGRNGVDGIIGWYVPQWMADGVPRHRRLREPQQVRRRCSRRPSRATRASSSAATRRS